MTERDLYLAALAKADPETRRVFLDEACAHDRDLRARVQSLLDAAPTEAVTTAGRAPAPAPPKREPSAPNSSVPVQARIAAGSVPRFADETLDLLRQRIRVIGLLTVAFLVVALLPTLHMPGLGLRLVVLGAVLTCYLVVRSSRPLSLRALRWLEGVTVACVTAQAMYMPSTLMLERARAGDFASVVMEAHFALGAWSTFLMGYGMLVPNTWRRTAALLVTMACVPYVGLYVLCWYEPAVQQAFAALHHAAPIPLPLFAALAGTYAAYVMHGMRKEAFRARRFGQYRLQERLGGGGMGEVYRAEHELLKRPCAIKLIRPGIDADVEAVARFEREVQATARLSHWNTVEIYDYGRTDAGAFYYVMELLPGMSLAQLVDRHGPLPPERTVYLLRQVCAALAEAHQLGLIHRDIKPANIFVARRGGVDDVVKLLDFGLVKLNDSGDDLRITQQGVISGSPPYMSPEQAAAGDGVDARSDIYSLGAVAYQMLTGTTPFAGRSAMDHIIAHARDPVQPPSERQAGIPADLEAVVLRCLEKQPERRFADVAALDRALAACACAGLWHAERAAHWWQTNAPEPSTSSGATHDPAATVTIDQRVE